MSLTKPAARTLAQPSLLGSSRCQCHVRTSRSWTRQQSSSARPQQKPTPPKRDRRYYLLALPLAFLPFSFFGSSKRPLDPYTYSDHPVASTSKLTPQHARVRIPLSPTDAALFAGASGDGVVTVEHVMIKNPDLQIERPYTPVNDIAKDGELDLVVKRVQGGEVGRMIHRLQPGGQVGLRGPISTMAIRPDQYDKIVMISTGTGVAPFLQLLSKIPPSPRLQLELIHSLTRPSDQDIDFVKHDSLLPALETRHPDLVVTRPPPGPIPGEMLESALSPRKQGKKVLVLVCLPQSLMRPLCGGLTIDMKQGEVSGTLGQMGLTNAEVYKLE